MDTLPGAIGLLAGAVSYMLGVCAPLGPGEMALPTPCPHWDVARLLGHLCESMADLEAALRTGRLELDEQVSRAGGDPVEALRDRAAELLCAGYCYGGPERFVAVGGLPIPAGLVACTGAVEIAVHGWDVSAARARAGRAGGVRETPIPAALATRMLRLGPLLVAGREGLFGVPVEVPAQASPGDRLVSYLGRHPGAAV
ncbi:MAG TPA: TIGR03086 family metal-binding protein [Streptosporangiaceae bacterium]|nr:TIGR03086 family metal-binding protein [Streptosporangiaceae bacterium]